MDGSRVGKAARMIPVMAVLVLAVGCAKRPATSLAAAPPPTNPPASAVRRAVATDHGPAKSSVTPTTATTSATRPAVAEFHENAALKDIHFDFDKFDIRKEDAAILDVNAAWLKAHPRALLLVEGNTDERGTNEYNLALGDRRAKATMNYLVARGIAGTRITTISYGEDRPLCTEHNEACWAKNRRAHFLVKAD